MKVFRAMLLLGFGMFCGNAAMAQSSAAQVCTDITNSAYTGTVKNNMAGNGCTTRVSFNGTLVVLNDAGEEVVVSEADDDDAVEILSVDNCNTFAAPGNGSQNTQSGEVTCAAQPVSGSYDTCQSAPDAVCAIADVNAPNAARAFLKRWCNASVSSLSTSDCGNLSGSYCQGQCCKYFTGSTATCF